MALIPPVIHNLGNADCLIFNHIWRYGYEDNSLLGHLKEFGNVYEILNLGNSTPIKLKDMIDILKVILMLIILQKNNMIVRM